MYRKILMEFDRGWALEKGRANHYLPVKYFCERLNMNNPDVKVISQGVDSLILVFPSETGKFDMLVKFLRVRADLWFNENTNLVIVFTDLGIVDCNGNPILHGDGSADGGDTDVDDDDDSDDDDSDDDLDEEEEEIAEERAVKRPRTGNTKTELNELLKETETLRKKLKERVKGQDHAIDAFVTALFGMWVRETDDSEEKNPRALFLFAGPAGVGKTFLAETAAEILDLPFLRLDMSSFSDGQEGPISFRGINASYKAAAPGRVTSFVKENPYCILLFDEIEKAHIAVIHLFLQILEGGVLEDEYMAENVSFRDAIIIMTTNAGKSVYEGDDKINFSDISEKKIISALKNDVNPANQQPFFPAPILSRISSGVAVMFNRLEPHSLCGIVKTELDKQLNFFRNKYGLDISYDKKLCEAMLYAGGGSADARNLKGVAKKFVVDEMLSLFLHMKAKFGENCFGKLKRIKFDLDFEDAMKEAENLFVDKDKPRVLFFVSHTAEKLLPEGLKDKCRAVVCSNPEKARELLRGNIMWVIIDPLCGLRKRKYSPADLEDADSDGTKFFRYISEYYPEIPVYMLETASTGGESNLRTFLSLGARGVIELNDDGDKFLKNIAEICDNARMLNSAHSLSRGSKALFYNCAQVFSDDGAKAEIKAAALTVKHSVDAEDEGDLLSVTSKPDVTFKDVIGATDAKNTLKEFIDYLKNPREYINKGVRIPRGVLLYGEPGTGKTLLARAMAGESDVAFIQKNGTEFLKSHVGEGPAEIRKTFRLARKYAPCILFIDEIDTFAKQRTGSEMTQFSEELQNAFLSEMDGFIHDEKRPVLVLAATNFGIDSTGRRLNVLDPAFVRRFDRKIKIELPNTEEREQFINYYLAKHGIKHIRADTIKNLAVRSIGRSAADLEMAVEYALRMAKGDKLTDEILSAALDADRLGAEKKWSEETVKKVSFHECGHALVSWLTGNNPSYITNISRGDFGGYMLPEVDDLKFEYTREELLDKICCYLGGRAAEIVYYGDSEGVTTGASSDLEAATGTAWALISRYGMEGSLATLDDRRMYDENGKYIAKINEILDGQLKRAIALISENKPAEEALAERLIEKNSLTAKEIDEVLSQYVRRN